MTCKTCNGTGEVQCDDHGIDGNLCPDCGGACEMTIEKEAEDCVYPDNNPMDAFWKSICDEHPCIGEELESIRFRIHKALQKKQDRIEELSLRDVNIRENLILNLDEDMSKLRELSTEQLVCKAVTGIFWRDKDIKNLKKKIEELESALKDLVDRLEFIHNDQEYIGVWVESQVHRGKYTGPTYEKELDRAKKAIGYGK